MERVLMSVHVERVDREVVRRQIERLEDLREREILAVAEDHDVLCASTRHALHTHIRALLHLELDEAQQVLGPSEQSGCQQHTF